VAESLLKKGFKLGDSKGRYLPAAPLLLTGDAAQKVLRLLGNLEDNDDVQNVYSNAEFDDATLAALS
jgi:transcriptional/translational regulatory protein YebC/TACO1